MQDKQLYYAIYAVILYFLLYILNKFIYLYIYNKKRYFTPFSLYFYHFLEKQEEKGGENGKMTFEIKTIYLSETISNPVNPIKCPHFTLNPYSKELKRNCEQFGFIG